MYFFPQTIYLSIYVVDRFVKDSLFIQLKLSGQLVNPSKLSRFKYLSITKLKFKVAPAFSIEFKRPIP